MSVAPEIGDPDELIVPAPSKPYEIAQLFLQTHYCDSRGRLLLHHRGLFYAWTGTHWPEGEARAVRADLYRWLEGALYWKGKHLVPFDPSSGKISNIVDALGAAVHVSETIEAPAWLDGAASALPREFVALRNGLLRLSTRELIEHTPNFFNAYALPFAYDRNAPEPARWKQFLNELWRDDRESISTLAEIMGYIIGGSTAQQKLFLLVGPKRAGKGTITRVLTALLGPENVAAPTLSSLAENFGLQTLVGKPLAAIADARLGGRSDSTIAVERLLSISGEDTITIDRKYRDPWTGRLPTRSMVLTNELPRLTDASGTIASRFVVLVLTNSFYGSENPGLTDELVAEAPGIFNWALEGLDRLNARGHFKQPGVSAVALRQLEDLASPVSAFVRDRCRIDDPGAVVNKDELWRAWKSWCEDEGARSGTKAVFIRDLRAAVPGTTPQRKKHQDGTREHVIAGIALAPGTVNSIPSIPDPSAPHAAANARGQGWQGSSPVFLAGSAGDASDEDEIERLAAAARRPVPLIGEDTYIEFLDQALAQGFNTERARRQRRLIHLSIRGNAVA
jgi:putative DNA primase/helicase